MSPRERWLTCGPVSDEAQDQLDRIVIGSADEAEQWARFAEKLTLEQRRAFEALMADLREQRSGSDAAGWSIGPLRAQLSERPSNR
jgi:hypothetical protein